MTVQEHAPKPIKTSRRRTTLIAASPLAMSALLWLSIAAMGPRIRTGELLERLPWCMALSALGPFSPQFLLGGRTMFFAMPWVALLLWSLYLLLVAKTPLGNVHWVLLLAGGVIWCALGTVMGSYAGLKVT